MIIVWTLHKGMWYVTLLLLLYVYHLLLPLPRCLIAIPYRQVRGDDQQPQQVQRARHEVESGREEDMHSIRRWRGKIHIVAYYWKYNLLIANVAYT